MESGWWGEAWVEGERCTANLNRRSRWGNNNYERYAACLSYVHTSMNTITAYASILFRSGALTLTTNCRGRNRKYELCNTQVIAEHHSTAILYKCAYYRRAASVWMWTNYTVILAIMSYNNTLLLVTSGMRWRGHVPL